MRTADEPPSEAFRTLQDFILKDMRMSHIYQPVMLRVLLESGRVTAQQVASAILQHDEAQLEYYETVVKRMPGLVLRNRGIVRRDGDGYALAVDFNSLTGSERAALQRLCDEALESFKRQRGTAVWAHRSRPSKPVPGSLRYLVLKRAGNRCELCGVPAEERALEVDHIVPRARATAKSGPRVNEPENLQALCWQCNANKRDTDSTRFSEIRESYSNREPGCPFCTVDTGRLIAQNSLAYAIWDGYPVSPLHALVIPRRHVQDFFQLHGAERNAVSDLLLEVRSFVQARDTTVAAFNVGVNIGESAGQTVLHSHIHLIPRRVGDHPNPRGGIRAVIPGKAGY